ncbi:uncharacterized protein [Amphiura filiformis]
MAAPSGKHDWSRRQDDDDDDDEVDPVDEMIKRTGCIEKHYAVQDCMAEHRDWRKCQPQVMEFRKCIAKSSADFHQRAKDGQLDDKKPATQ